MKKLSIIIPTFQTPLWNAIFAWHFKTYGVPIDSEIIVVDNAPEAKAIKVITETSLGEGIKVINGNQNLTSHGEGYNLAYEASDGDFVFCAESDSYPTRYGWFDGYVKLSADYAMVGPEMPMGAGKYVHPAGCAIRRDIIEAAKQWQNAHKDWMFCPGCAPVLGLNDKGYHVVAHEDWLALRDEIVKRQVLAAAQPFFGTGPFQEMRSFDPDDSFDTYMQRTTIDHFEPDGGRKYFLRIGYESGQWLHYFARHKGFKIFEIVPEIKWMEDRVGCQAAYSTILGGFTHIWGGSVTSIPSGIDPVVRAHKQQQALDWFAKLPVDIQKEVNDVREKYKLP